MSRNSRLSKVILTLVAAAVALPALAAEGRIPIAERAAELLRRLPTE